MRLVFARRNNRLCHLTRRRSILKFLDEYRDPVAAKKLQQMDLPQGDAAVDADGDLRRADAHDRQIRHRRVAAAALSWCMAPAAPSA